MASAEQLKGCAAAIGATAFVAIALLVIEDRVAALQTFLLPFIVPVVAASWWGGLRCGLLATALNFGVVVTFFSGPDQGLNLAHGVDQARLTLFVAIAAIISVASDRLHRFRKQAAVTEAVAAERERALQHEIGERRKAERHLRLVLEGLPQLVWTCQADGSADYHSPQWVSYTGLSAEECRGDGWTKAIHPDDLPGLMNRWLQATTADVVFESEYRLRSHAGEYRWFKSRAVLLPSPEGERRWFGTSTDIHERKEMERQLQELNADLERRVLERTRALEETERRFRAIFHSQFQFIGLLSPDGRILEANRMALGAVNATAADVVGRPFWDSPWWRHDPVQQERLKQAVQSAAAGRQDRFEASHVAASGELIWVDFSLTPCFNEAGEVTLLIPEGRDVSQQKNAQRALAANDALLRQFIKYSPAAIAMFDREVRYLQCSDRWKIDYRLDDQEIIGRSHYDVFPDVPERWKAIHQRVLAGAVEKCEEDPFPRENGETAWLQWECQPWRNADDAIGGLIMFTQVVTERKLGEQRLKASLREKDILLREIHHRVKNNLQIVSTLLDLQSDHASDARAAEMFRESRGRVKSMALIHERLYRAHDVARVDFSEYVQRLVADLYQTYRASTGVEIEVDVDVPPMGVDAAIPCGLLLNELVSNCFKHAFAGETAGRIRVSFHRLQDMNVLRISDNGVGFSANVDFRRTDSFGLQLVLTLVDQLRGSIDLIADEGASFVIRFPASID